MSESRTRGVMIFVLGLVLVAIGIGISTITQTEIIYQNFYGYQVPIGSRIVQPYLSFGIFMALFGVVAILGGLVDVTRNKRKILGKDVETQSSSYQPLTSPQPMPAEQPVVEHRIVISGNEMVPCEYCGSLMQVRAHFCPNCGVKRGTKT